MSRRKKLLLGALVIGVLGLVAYLNLGMKRSTSINVTAEKIERRDLESIVSASGKVRPKKQVNISAETSGKVVSLRVAEGETVKKGQILLQIDPRNLETAVQNREASLARAKSQLEQTKGQIQNAKIALKESEDNLKRIKAQVDAGLIPREQLERAQNEFQRQTTNLAMSEQSVTTQEQAIKQEEASLESARYDLNKVTLFSPIDGLVTRRNIEEGETAVVGTMNNAGTVLLTIADLSIIETEIEVDETDIPYIKIGQSAKITIDAIENRTFTGKVTEVGNSPIQTQAAQTGRATNFKVVVTVDGTVPNVRPGFTCTAVVTTATRQKALSVPTQAMTLREMPVDAEGQVVHTPPPVPGQPRPTAPPPSTDNHKTRKELEGVFVVKDGRAVFTMVKTGIAGEKYSEVVEGLNEGDEVITGPFSQVRGLRDGDAVTVTGTTPGSTGTSSGGAPRAGEKLKVEKD
jgi:HlyD family secretion protein